MGMTKKVITWLYLHNAIAQWSITPMGTRGIIKYHHGWFVGNNHICIARNKALLMIVSKAIELNSIYFYTAVLKKVNIFRQVLDTFCIP